MLHVRDVALNASEYDEKEKNGRSVSTHGFVVLEKPRPRCRDHHEGVHDVRSNHEESWLRCRQRDDSLQSKNLRGYVSGKVHMRCGPTNLPERVDPLPKLNGIPWGGQRQRVTQGITRRAGSPDRGNDLMQSAATGHLSARKNLLICFPIHPYGSEPVRKS